jgi:hypothetical protein
VDRNKENSESHKRDEFAKSTFPLIKKKQGVCKQNGFL